MPPVVPLYRCAGCGEYVPPDEVTDDWHVRVDHAPECGTARGVSCEQTCPVQVQCGPVERVAA